MSVLLGQIDIVQPTPPSSALPSGFSLTNFTLSDEQKAKLSEAAKAQADALKERDPEAYDLFIKQGGSNTGGSASEDTGSDVVSKLKKYAPYIIGTLVLLYFVRRKSTI
jgi:hypothetical protein